MTAIVPQMPQSRDWRDAVDEADRVFNYGSVIPKAWLEVAFEAECPDVASVAEFKQSTLRFFAAMGPFRDTLLTRHKKALRSMGRGEWLVVHPRDQGALALETACRGVVRALVSAAEIQENTRLEMLDVDERRRHADAAAKLAALRGLTQRALAGGDK